MFTSLPSPMQVARYHSLIIARPALPDSLRVLASALDDGAIMAVEHRSHPVVGVQFHPESAATEYGYAMLDRFVRGEGSSAAQLPRRADGAGESIVRAAPWSSATERDRAFVPPPVELVR